MEDTFNKVTILLWVLMLIFLQDWQNFVPTNINLHVLYSTLDFVDPVPSPHTKLQNSVLTKYRSNRNYRKTYLQIIVTLR